MEAAFEVTADKRIEGENPLPAKKETTRLLKSGIEKKSSENNRTLQNVDEKDSGGEISSEKIGDEKSDSGENHNCEKRGEENTDDKKDSCHDLNQMLSSIKANLDLLAENCRSVHERMNNLELDSISLLQPLGNVISLERQLKRLSEIESNYMRKLSKD